MLNAYVGIAGGGFFYHWREAAGKNHVDGGVSHVADLVFGEQRAIRSLDPHTMRRNHIGTKQAYTVHVFDGGGLVLHEAVVQFFFDLRDVDQNGRVIFLC